MSRTVEFALGGFGNVGQQIARAVLRDPEGGLRIGAITARDLGRARERASALGLEVPVVPARELPAHAETVVECATYEGFRPVVEPALTAGRHVVCVSVGALGVNLDLVDLAAAKGATLQIASGALPGLDILRAAREGSIESVSLRSQILPASLARESYIADHDIDLDRARSAPVPVFSGSARDAARHFPRHFNVAVALSLAGIGLDRTQVEILADASIPGARHTVSIVSDVVHLEMTAQNFPSPENNRTSRIVAPSILAALRETGSSLRIGS